MYMIQNKKTNGYVVTSTPKWGIRISMFGGKKFKTELDAQNWMFEHMFWINAKIKKSDWQIVKVEC